MKVLEDLTRTVALLQKLALMPDEQATRLVQRIGQGKTDTGGEFVTDLSADLQTALREKFALGDVPSGAVPPVNLARQALLLLAEDDPTELDRYLQAGETEGLVVTIAVVTAALVILQTEITVKKQKGKWSFRLRKRSASDSLLVSFIKSIVGLA
jgi:hypothetical protein